jgi:hypothetical protein
MEAALEDMAGEARIKREWLPLRSAREANAWEAASESHYINGEMGIPKPPLPPVVCRQPPGLGDEGAQVRDLHGSSGHPAGVWARLGGRPRPGSGGRGAAGAMPTLASCCCTWRRV